MSIATALPSAKPRILRPWQSAVLVVVLAVVVAAVYANTRTKAEVRVIHPAYGDLESTVSSTGTVTPLNDYPARANFTGQVEKIYVHVGEKVHAGQMLVRLKDQYAVPRLEKARADLADAELTEQNLLHNGSQEDRIGSRADQVKAQTEREQAAAALEAMQKIEKNGSVSGAEMEAAKQRLQTADANLAALNKKLTNRYSPLDIQSCKEKVAAGRAAVQAEKISWANANISTPIAGTVYVMPVRLWDFVPAGGAMLHVADLSKIQVRANFEEPDMAKLYVGQAVSVTWDGAPGRTWHGHLESKPLGVTRSGARSVGECIITLDDDKGDLPIDTNVAVIVSVEKKQHVLNIPREALHSENGAHFVYVVDGGHLKRRPIETGLASAMSIEIKGGLSPQDALVLHANDDQKLSDGMRVSAKE